MALPAAVVGVVFSSGDGVGAGLLLAVQAAPSNTAVVRARDSLGSRSVDVCNLLILRVYGALYAKTSHDEFFYGII